jgi:hypothetical protein
MVPIVVALAAGVVAGRLLAPRRSRPLLRWWPVLAIGVVAQGLGQHGPLALLLVGLVALVVGCAANAAVTGAVVIAAGVAMNFAVIALNQDMPVRADALVRAGLVDAHTDVYLRGHRRLEEPGDPLVVLDDRIPVRPIHAVMSMGDLLVVAGLVVTAASVTRRVQTTASVDQD